MIVQLWEVSGSFEGETETMCIGFKSKQSAEQQTVFAEVEYVCPAKVEMTEDEIIELNAKGYIWL